ncbi:unnamed protein product [Prunus armeniaca]
MSKGAWSKRRSAHGFAWFWWFGCDMVLTKMHDVGYFIRCWAGLFCFQRLVSLLPAAGGFG